MAHFFPAASRLDTERNPSLNRRAHSRNTLRETTGSNDIPSDTHSSRPSHVNWLQNPMASNQAGPPMPRRPPSARLGRSSSLSALAPPPPALHRQSSIISNHSLQLGKSASSSTGNPAAASTHPVVKQLSPISERSYVPTPKREQFAMDVEPTTPVSIGSSYSAFLRRPLRRSISATSTSSLRTNTTSQLPILPPLNLSPVDIRPVYPPVSHRAGQQLVSTVYEDAGSERTLSFVTARSDSDDEEDAEDSVVAPNAPGPSNSTILSSTTHPGSKSDLDRAIEGTTLTTTQPSGSGLGESSSGSAFGPVAPARPRPRRRVPTPGSGSGASTSDSFIWRRRTPELSLGSRLSRPSFSAARRAIKSRLPPLPILLFWAGFLAPWCWLIGGWLITEGRWEDSGKVRAALPLWKPRPARGGAAAGKGKEKGPRRGAGGAGAGARENQTAVAGGPPLPFDPFAKDLEQGDAAAAAGAFTALDGQAGGEGTRTGHGAGGPVGGPRQWWYWVPCACWTPFARLRHRAAVPAPGPGASQNVGQVVTFVKPYSAEVWVYRCRLAAVLSALVLLIALIVALVVLRHSNS